MDILKSNFRSNRNTFFLLSFFLLNTSIFSQINPDVNFYPLHVGDTWQYLVEYKYRDTYKDSSYYATVTVRGVDSLYGKAYFAITNSENYCLKHIRIDTTDATLWELKGEYECMIDSLSMSVDDMMGLENICIPKICNADTVLSILNEERRVKTFSPVAVLTGGLEQVVLYKYGYGLGLLYSETTDISIEASRVNRTLVYANIDGKEYGKFVPTVNPDVEFYPLHVGDIRTYEVRFNDNTLLDSVYFETVTVTSTKILDGKKYFEVVSTEEGISFIRVDSSSATVWKHNNGSECMIDSLSLQTDTVLIQNDCALVTFYENRIDTIFNQEVETREFKYPFTVSSGTIYYYTYAKGFGLTSYSQGVIDVWITVTNKKLIYAKVDGVEYSSNKDSLGYFPLQVGNRWVYNLSGVSYDDYMPSPFNYDIISEIVADTIINDSIKYYKMKEDGIFTWLRFDPIFNKIFRKYNLSNDFECLFVDFSTETSEKYETCTGNVYNTSNLDTLIWNENRSMKKYFYESLFNYESSYVNGIGIVEKKNEFDFGYSTLSLKGCIINGTIYGDTTVVSIDEKEDELLTEFSLSQNYPNPFNPSTTIKYSIPLDAYYESTTNVVLKVYDILGREVAVLVNQQQKAGNYEVKFDASSLTSGIYFYRLQSGNFVASKKLLLLK